MFFEVIPTTVFRRGSGILTYSSETPLLPGHLVLIPLGKKTVTGVVLRPVKTVTFSTKPITKLISPLPLPRHLLDSILWLSKYYLTPLPTAANLVIPAGIASRNAFRSLSAPQDANSLKLPLINLNSAQQKALKALYEAPGSTRLLRGVTGSGKTNIYLKMTANALQEQKSTILLVPEIALTSQLIKIFRETFGDRVLLIHSQQTPAERRATWINILQRTTEIENKTGVKKAETNNKTQEYQNLGLPCPPRETKRVAKLATMNASPVKTGAGVGLSSEDKTSLKSGIPEPLIIIGPRSALLTPVANLGLIIIDEAHEGAYYQENTPRYSSLRLASFIAQDLKIPCIQGTATPNLVDFHLAKTHDSLIELSEKAKNTAITPEISIIDLRDRTNFCKNRYFSDRLLTKISENLQKHHQTLIFHNRRGSAPITLCEECGWQALCPQCYLPLALHSDDYTLSCHICGHAAKVPSNCPECHHVSVIHKGFGTKLLEAELKSLFPKANIARFDGDNRKGEDLATLYHEVKTGEIDLLIGTQTLARGLDLPHLATVGIVQADAGLTLPDFAAEERAFELLTQVIGRVGRGHLNTADVILQSYQPDHPVIQTAIQADYPKFAEYALKQRRRSQLPPYIYLAKLAITYKTEKTTLAKIGQARQALAQNPHLILSPPTPAFHERTNRGYTWEIIIKSTSRNQLTHALQPFSMYHIELDPPSLL